MNNIIEELNRLRLMMKYDTSKTLNENKELTKDLLIEAPKVPKAKPKIKSPKIAPHVPIVNKLKAERGVLSKNFDNALDSSVAKGKTLSKKTISKHKAELLDKDVEIFANTPKKDGTFPIQKEIDDFQFNQAEKIIKNVDNKVLTKTPKTVTKNIGNTTNTGGRGKGRNKKNPNKRRAQKGEADYKVVTGKPTRWQVYKDKIKGLTRNKTLRYLAGAGGLYLALKWWFAEGSAPFPDCIGKNIPVDDFKKMCSEGDGSVLNTDTGIDDIDRVGGGRFYDDKKFVTGDGRYSGNWEDVPGVGIVITIEGNQYTMSCEGVVDDTEDIEDTEDTENEDNEDEGGVITYRSCSSAPFGLGCISNDIKFVQSCLGIEPVDGKLGPITKSGLKENGYSVPLSQSDLDKIKKECTSSNQDTPVDPLSGEQSLEVETGESPSYTSQEVES